MNCFTRYKAELRQHLKCSRTTKNRLMENFRNMLQCFLEENESADHAALVAAFGTPSEMAATLMAEIPQEEIKRYKEHDRRKPLYIAIAILLTLLICVYVFFIKQKPLVQIDEHSVSPTIQSSTIE